MKRNYKSGLTILLLATIFASCQKYLDIVENGNIAIVRNAADCQALLDDYGTMNSSYPYDMLLSADEYFLTPADYNNASHDLQSAVISRWDTLAIRLLADQPWTSAYKLVMHANLVIEEVERLRKEGSTPATVLDGLEGAALFYRSFTFWLMAQMYAAPYQPATADSKPGIPLRLSSDLSESVNRGTVKATYDRILTDVKRASTLLPSTVNMPSRPSQVAAYALLARCYLSMSDYPNALTNATAALGIKNALLDYNELSAPWPGGRFINTKFNSEILFQALAHEDYYGLFSNTKVSITPNLLEQYTSGDLRKDVFFSDLNNDGHLKFIGSYDASSTLFIGLATDEVYLIRAECHARNGNKEAAMADLNTLLRKRFSAPYTDITATDAEDALNKVLWERRKELLLRGVRWTDLRRLNLDPKTATTISRVFNNVTYSLPPNDLRYTLLIPQEVIDNASMEQNQR